MQLTPDTMQPWGNSTTWANNPKNLKFIGTPVPTFRCPSEPLPATWTAAEMQWDTAHGDVIPANNPIAMTSYAGNWGSSRQYDSPNKVNNNGIFMYRRLFKSKQILDGLSRTMFLGEIRRTDFPDWSASRAIWSYGERGQTMRATEVAMNVPTAQFYDPTDLNEDCGFGSYHAGGAQFAFGDGRVEFLSEDMDLTVYRAISTREKGEIVSEK